MLVYDFNHVIQGMMYAGRLVNDIKLVVYFD